MPSPDRTCLISEVLDSLLSVATREELLLIAAICSRGQTQALVQYAVRLKEEPVDTVLLTPEQIVAESEGSVTLWSVREAMRQGRLPKRAPCPGATRGFRVPRSAVKAWLAK